MSGNTIVKDIKRYPDALTVKEVAEILRICTKTAYKLINENTIPSVRIGRESRVLKRDLMCYLRAKVG